MKDTLKLEAQRHLKKLKRKKGKPPKSLAAFNSFFDKKEIVEIEKAEIVVKEKHIPHKIKVYDQILKRGGKFTDKMAKRYIKAAKLWKLPIPVEVQGIYDGIKVFREKKQKVKKIKESKRERVPSKYAAYIKSKFWRRRRDKYYQDFGRYCQICDSTIQMTVHHLVYNNATFGNEPNDTLIGLCWSCHEEFHQQYGVKKDCRADFSQFVGDKLVQDNMKFLQG